MLAQATELTHALITKLEIFGSFSVVLLLLIIAVVFLYKKNKELEGKYEKMTEKSITALTLAHKTMESSQQIQAQNTQELRDLASTVANSKSCNYGN